MFVRAICTLSLAAFVWLPVAAALAQDPLPQAMIDGTGPGWKEMSLDDFQMVNGDEDTWTWKDNVIHCTGQPVGVRSATSNAIVRPPARTGWVRQVSAAGSPALASSEACAE